MLSSILLSVETFPFIINLVGELTPTLAPLQNTKRDDKFLKSKEFQTTIQNQWNQKDFTVCLPCYTLPKKAHFWKFKDVNNGWTWKLGSDHVYPVSGHHQRFRQSETISGILTILIQDKIGVGEGKACIVIDHDHAICQQAIEHKATLLRNSLPN